METSIGRPLGVHRPLDAQARAAGPRLIEHVARTDPWTGLGTTAPESGQARNICSGIGAKDSEASGQLSGGLPDSCAESFRTAVRKASGKLSGEVPDRSGLFQGKSLETDLAKCLDRESNPGSSQAEPSVAPAAPQRPPSAGPAVPRGNPSIPRRNPSIPTGNPSIPRRNPSIPRENPSISLAEKKCGASFLQKRIEKLSEKKIIISKSN